MDKEPFARGELKNLDDVETWMLVETLRMREGVETRIVEPYVDETITVNGPAIVLVVID